MTNPTNANATLAGVANAEGADIGGLQIERSTGANAACEVRRSIALVDAQNGHVKGSEAVTFAELAQRCATPTIGPKDGPGWVPAVIAPGPRKGERVEAVTFLVLDVEADALHVKDEKGEPVRDHRGDIVKRVTGPEPPDVDAMLAELELSGWRCILHTSYSQGGSILPEGIDHPRYRLIFDLSRTLAREEVKPLAHHVAGLLGLADCVDKGCMEPSRLFYTPRCPEERRRLFRHAVVDGAALDVDALLGEARKIEAARHAAQTRRKGAKSASVIDAFNATHNPGAILEAYGYAPKGRGRWLAPTSTTGMPGVRLLPDSTPPRIYSSHSGDPLADGHAHDAFDCWQILAHGGDTGRAVRAAADLLGMARQPAQEAPQATRADSVVQDVQEAANDAPRPVVRNAADLLTRAFAPVQWGIRGILPEGISILSGDPKIGKSWLLYQACIAVATGKPLWHGREPEEQGDALMLALEDNDRRLQRRLQTLLPRFYSTSGRRFNYPTVDRLHYATEWPRAERGVAHLAQWLRDHPQTRLVVIDTVSAFRDPEPGRKSAYATDYAVGAMLKPLTMEFSCAVVLVMHNRKQHSEDALQLVSGTQGMTGGVDNVLVLRRERGKMDAGLYVDGRDIEEPQEVAMHFNDGYWSSDGQSVDDARMSRERRDVLQAVAELGDGAKVRAIADALPAKKFASVKSLLSKMVKAGSLRLADGVYVVPAREPGTGTGTDPGTAEAA